MSDKFYSLKVSTEITKIGKGFPQTDGMGKGYNLRGPNSAWNIKNYAVLDFIPDLNYFNIDKRAILTDFISTAIISADGFLINDKVGHLLDDFVLTKHTYYQATLKYRNKMFSNYFWLHFTFSDDDLIDFEKSSFILTEPLPFFRTQEIHVNSKSKAEILEIWKKENSLSLFPNKIIFKPHQRQDLYSFSFLWQRHYISENLFTRFESEKISGIDTLIQSFTLE